MARARSSTCQWSLPVAKVKAEGADLVFLLTHASLSTLEGLLPEVPGVSLAFAGQERRLGKRLERVGDTLVAGGGDRGRTIGHLELTLEERPYGLSDGGEAEALRSDLENVERRIGYYRKMLEDTESKADDKAADKRRGLAEKRLPKLELELVEKTDALEKAKAAPPSKNRVQLTLAAMGTDLPDHPAVAPKVAAWKAKGGGKKAGRTRLPHPKTPGLIGPSLTPAPKPLVPKRAAPTKAATPSGP